ncbi:sugar phosphate isomerase/epimerase family protein [Tamlana sp. I1]|uniref:sugar phosphate isomerase/epimerase family protein n=1 Tax=Tamlana sp. I1 TaxID=2762061 RepID=UPI001E568592|nr:sugar phosphate isomerase/epimerase [Tamlana sp. I1]
MATMKIDYYCPYWGSDHLSNDDFFTKVKDAGYDGVEYPIGSQVSKHVLDTFWEGAVNNDLKIIIQHYDTRVSNFTEHADIYAAWFEKIAAYPCVKVNSQTGKDYFSFEQNKQLIDIADDFAAKHKVSVLHETHRNKFSFAAHITKSYLEKLQDLKLTLDISHWVNVAESLLEDQQEAVDLAISRVDHIHARVGHPQGPQINDPRAPENKDTVAAHLKWWDKVIVTNKNKGMKNMSISPEFGPMPYMPALAFTQQPVSSQWDINVYMMNLLRKRYTM